MRGRAETTNLVARSRRADDAAVELAWKEHQDADHVPTPFQSWEWFSSLTDSEALTADVEVLCAEDGSGRIVGLLALGWAATGKLPTLGFAGWDYTTPDHVDVIAAPEDRRRCAHAFASHLAGRRDWAMVDFDGIAAGSALGPALAAALRPPRYVTLAAEDVVCRYLPLDPDKGMENVPSRSTRKQARQDLRRAEAGGGGFDRVTDPDTVDAAFDSLVALHRKRFPRSPVFATPEREQFQRRAARRLLTAGLARIYRLTVGDRLVAISYLVTAHGVAGSYLSGRDDEAGLLHSPGRTLRAGVIGDLAADRFREYDGLRGGHEYKTTLTDSERTDLRVRHVRVGRRSIGWAAPKLVHRLGSRLGRTAPAEADTR